MIDAALQRIQIDEYDRDILGPCTLKEPIDHLNESHPMHARVLQIIAFAYGYLG